MLFDNNTGEPGTYPGSLDRILKYYYMALFSIKFFFRRLRIEKDCAYSSSTRSALDNILKVCVFTPFIFSEQAGIRLFYVA